MRRFRFGLVVLLLVIISAKPAVRGQSVAQHIPSASDSTFNTEPYVIHAFSTVTSMNADGTGTRVQQASVKINSEAALRQFSVVSLPFASQSGQADFVYARVRHPDGTAQDTPTSDAIEQTPQVTREAPAYSDLKSKDLPIKNLRVGDRLEWEARYVTTHPEIPGEMWGAETFLAGAVVLQETHELHVPASVHLTVWTNPRAGVSASESLEGSERLYRWSHAELHPTVGAAADAERQAKETRVLSPEEQREATEGKLPDFAWTTFPDWASVGDWYRSLVAGRSEPDTAIRAKVAELTAGKTTDLARAQVLYNYVSSQIRYVGVSFGIGRFRPHTAAEVFANQFGDCKDKHTLLASMLGVAGLTANPVLIGAGIRLNASVPSPASFNHLVTRLRIDNADVWLDSTTEVAPWRVLAFPIRDKDALVIPTPGPAIIARTPAALPFEAFASSTASGSLDASLTSDSQMVFTYRGDDELTLRSVLRTLSPSNYGAFVQQFMAGLGFGGTTSGPSFSNVDDTSQPISLSFHYHRVKEADWGENRITVAFQPITLPTFTAQRPPIVPVQLGMPRTETSTVELTLPAGWNASLPEAVHAVAPFAACDVTYRLTGGKLFAERRLRVLRKEVSLAEYKQYQSWYDAAGASGVPFLQLTPPIAPTTTATSPKPEAPSLAAGSGPAPTNPQAAELVQKAGQRLGAMDPDGARKLLDQARALNSTERGLWMAYAAVAGQFGKLSEGIEDLETELRLFPDEVRIYRYLSVEQSRRGDQAAALNTLRSWVKAAPKDPNAALLLVQQLLFSKDANAALTEARAGMARMESTDADLTRLRLAEAQALSALGQKKEAGIVVQPLLRTTVNPDQINTITYFMADAGLDLGAAEAAQRSNVASLEEQTRLVTLDETGPAVTRTQALLAASWDTLGWILFQQGKSADALSYIAAAARTRANPEINAHLSAASSALKSSKFTELAKQSDQQRRTFALGPAHGHYGTAEFRVLIAGGKVIAIAETGQGANSTSSTSPAPFGSPFPGAEQTLKGADLHALFPTDSNAHIIRSGFVNCHPNICELVLAPLAP